MTRAVRAHQCPPGAPAHHCKGAGYPHQKHAPRRRWQQQQGQTQHSPVHTRPKSPKIPESPQISPRAPRLPPRPACSLSGLELRRNVGLRALRLARAWLHLTCLCKVHPICRPTVRNAPGLGGLDLALLVPSGCTYREGHYLHHITQLMTLTR